MNVVIPTRRSVEHRTFFSPFHAPACGMLIASARLDLIPMTPAFLRASLADDLTTAAAELPGILPAEWPDIIEILSMRLDQIEEDPTLIPWLLRSMVLRETREMVGYIGFHTAPAPAYLEEWCPGAIEFGFTIFHAHRRHGYAREAAEALMNWATTYGGARDFILTIDPENTASQALAKSLGFTRIGSHQDETDGEEDVLLKHVR